MNRDKLYYTEINGEEYREKIKLLQERIQELTKTNEDLLNKLTKTAMTNGDLIKILKEVVYNNNTTPAEEYLKEVEPSFDVYHTRPQEFLDLSEKQQRTLLDNIPLNIGDIFYCIEDKSFYTLCSIDENIVLYSPDFTGESYFKPTVIGEQLIPCYSAHQLWYFIDYFLDETTDIRLTKGLYGVYLPCLERYMGFGNSKIEALWKTVVNITR
jgi:hypothetical protein